MTRTAEEWQQELEARLALRSFSWRTCEICGESFKLDAYGFPLDAAEVILSHNVTTRVMGRRVILAAGSRRLVHHEPCAQDHELA